MAITDKNPPESYPTIKQEKALNIHQRILAATKDLDSVRSQIKTDKDVKSGDRVLYSVISRDSVIRIVTPIMVKHGINAVMSVIEHERIGNMTIIKASMRYVNTDDPKDFVEINSIGYGIDQQDKGSGKAQTYVERYAHQKMFKIPTGVDIEDDQIEFKKDPISDAQVITLREVCESYEWDAGEVLKNMAKKVYGLKSITELPEDKFEEAQGLLEKKHASQS